ncbi:hypothetical protein Taro_044068 [Colocasia esculenta]|uniref:Iron-related transcription factor 3 bHLH domain-containing protein n=1 Tax=Colocasia esculenta TaxID=4460 RepID=A0A843X2Q8_COLES|nr:hypothetical protein [Colocasia esculenta]
MTPLPLLSSVAAALLHRLCYLWLGPRRAGREEEEGGRAPPLPLLYLAQRPTEGRRRTKKGKKKKEKKENSQGLKHKCTTQTSRWSCINSPVEVCKPPGGEPTRQNNGKATILGDASRFLRDLLAQVESLRRENAALATESRYVTEEKNELRDENIALEAEIRNLQKELQERMQSKPAWGNGADAPAAGIAQPPTTALTPPPVVGPVFVIPLNQELPQTYPPEAVHHVASSPPKPPSHIRRPHARYPTPSDAWPLHILSQHQRSSGNPSTNSG